MSEQKNDRGSGTNAIALQTVSISSIPQLLRLLNELDRESQHKHCQSRKLDVEVDAVDTKKETIERHIIQTLKASDTTVLRVGDICIKLNKSDPKVVIYNKDAVPEQFAAVYEQKVIDEDAIRNALQKGLDIPGVTLQSHVTVEIGSTSTPNRCA